MRTSALCWPFVTHLLLHALCHADGSCATHPHTSATCCILGPFGLPGQVAKCYELPVASQARACQRRSSKSNSAPARNIYWDLVCSCAREQTMCTGSNYGKLIQEAPVWEVCGNSCSVTRLGPLRTSPSHLLPYLTVAHATLTFLGLSAFIISK